MLTHQEWILVTPDDKSYGFHSFLEKSPVFAVERSIIDFCLWNTLRDSGSLNSGVAGDIGADDPVIVAIFVFWENVAFLPTRLR